MDLVNKYIHITVHIFILNYFIYKKVPTLTVLEYLHRQQFSNWQCPDLTMLDINIYLFQFVSIDQCQ